MRCIVCIPAIVRWPCVRAVSLSLTKSLVASFAAELVATATTCHQICQYNAKLLACTKIKPEH